MPFGVDTLLAWFTLENIYSTGLDLLSIILLLVFVRCGLTRLTVWTVNWMDGPNFGERITSRQKTMVNIISKTGKILIYSILLFMVLDLIGVDLRPITAGLGIASLARVFAAKTTISDIFAGCMIILQN